MFASQLNRIEFELLYTMLLIGHTIPAIFLPFYVDFFLDKFGPKILYFIFNSCLFVGAILFGLGIFLRSFFLMIIGRIIYGIGAD